MVTLKKHARKTFDVESKSCIPGKKKLPEMFGSKSSNRLVEGIADGLLSLDS